MHVQVLVFKVQRHCQTFALNRRKQGRVYVEIDGVAELVGFADGFRLDAGREMPRVMTADRTFAQTPQQISQRLVAEKIQSLFGNFKLDVAWQGFFNLSLSVAPQVAPPFASGMDREITFLDR